MRGVKTPNDYDFTKDPEMREILYGEGGPFDTSPPVLPMLKKWRGAPPMHLDTTLATTKPVRRTAKPTT